MKHFTLILTFTVASVSLWAKSQESLPIVVVRSPLSNISDYYRYLSSNPNTKNPSQAFELNLSHEDVSESYFKMASDLEKTTDPTKKKLQREELLVLIYQLPVSYERFHLLESISKNLKPKNSLNDDFIQDIELELRRLREISGGEDLILYIDHNKWGPEATKALQKDPFATLTLLSSAWKPCSFTGQADLALEWLRKLQSCESWISGNSKKYQWSSLSYLENYRREVFWDSDDVKADNWFNPNQLISNNTNITEEDYPWSKWLFAAALASGLHFLYQNRNREIVIQFQ